MPSEAFVTGGSGLLGGHLISRLIGDGVSVRALARSDAAAASVAERGATPIRGDLFNDDALRAGMSGADVVFHVAGINEMCTSDPGVMDRVNVAGTVSVIQAASANGVRRVVYTSSAAAVGEETGEIGKESTVHSGEYVSAYARSKHVAEVVAFEVAEELGVDLVAVNPSSVQGPGRATGSAALLIRALNSKRPLLFDSTLSIVDIEDCTTGHVNAAKYGMAGERYLLSGATLTVADAIDLLANASGRSIRPRWLSRAMVQSAGMAVARVAAVVRPSLGVCPELITTLLHG
ncbi:MAG: NAD-dependent epimerase/dehydratase family protein, partial [Actinomycetia bacterium]|nr:NAD-dependent epimerase/dehydratase family protein [Actinomycetes bacterium]